MLFISVFGMQPVSPDLNYLYIYRAVDWSKWLQQLAPLSNFCLLTDSGKVSLQNERAAWKSQRSDNSSRNIETKKSIFICLNFCLAIVIFSYRRFLFNCTVGIFLTTFTEFIHQMMPQSPNLNSHFKMYKLITQIRNTV